MLRDRQANCRRPVALPAEGLAMTAHRASVQAMSRSGRARNFFVERVEKPTDNKTSRCFATAADASRPLSAFPRQWRSVVIGPGALLNLWPKSERLKGYRAIRLCHRAWSFTMLTAL